MKGYIHIYCGDGKGKTTAATGLAIRALGNGARVLMARFLKDQNSCELAILRDIKGIELISCDKSFGFSWQMTEEEKEHAKQSYAILLKRAFDIAIEGEYQMLILDEIMVACNLGFVNLTDLIGFIEQKPTELELILTGRNPDPKLIQLSDYVSEISKIKHPLDCGVAARRGIEY